MTDALKKIIAHSDGGCHGNPGPGGWAAVLIFGSHRREISGGELATTNNRMELTAAIEALSALKEPCEIEFFTDSEYVKNGVTKWVVGWKRNGWRTQERKPVKNADLWRKLDAAASRHRITWKWLKGHSGHIENECCDRLASQEINAIKKRHTSDDLKTALKNFAAAVEATPRML